MMNKIVLYDYLRKYEQKDLYAITLRITMIIIF